MCPSTRLLDLQGRKMRMSGNVLHNSMWTAAGAITSAIALSETFNALSQGVVEMQENPYDMIYDNSFYEVQKVREPDQPRVLHHLQPAQRGYLERPVRGSAEHYH
ncbi:MAG: hypothetical protein ACLTYL_00380 [Faecalibacterium sp.]